MARKLEPKKGVQMIDVRLLEPWEKNPRGITKARFADLKRDLSTDPLMMRARPTIAVAAVDYAPDGTVVAGNMRTRAARELVEGGDERFLAEFPGGKVPTYLVALDEPRARQWALRDNNPYGEWEDEALHEFMVELQRLGGEVDLTGFPEGDVQMILEGVAPRGGQPFRALDEDIEAEFRCPGCGYEWSGNPSPGDGAVVSPAVEQELERFVEWAAEEKVDPDAAAVATYAAARNEQAMESPVKERS